MRQWKVKVHMVSHPLHCLARAPGCASDPASRGSTCLSWDTQAEPCLPATQSPLLIGSITQNEVQLHSFRGYVCWDESREHIRGSPICLLGDGGCCPDKRWPGAGELAWLPEMDERVLREEGRA